MRRHSLLPRRLACVISCLLASTRLDKYLDYQSVTLQNCETSEPVCSAMQRRIAILILCLLVRTRLDKHRCRPRLTPLCSQMQRRGATLILRLLIRTCLNEQRHSSRVGHMCSVVQRRPAILILSLLVFRKHLSNLFGNDSAYCAIKCILAFCK